MPVGQFTILEWRALSSWIKGGLFPSNTLRVRGKLPTVNVGANLGAAGAVQLVAGSTDAYGELIVTCGSPAAAGEQAIVNFANTLATVNFDPILGLAGASMGGCLYISETTATTFKVSFSAKPVDGGVYFVPYFNVQT